METEILQPSTWHKGKGRVGGKGRYFPYVTWTSGSLYPLEIDVNTDVGIANLGH